MLPDGIRPAPTWRDVVDQAPVLGPPAAHTIFRRAEHVGQIPADLPLVDHARKTAGPRQNGQKRDFGKRNG